ncbi:hypothetical protein K9S39_23550 [Streptomyces halobius]|uniref:Amidase domain-containing protein n=1 Tax=Streptomyces halobius TaxID=2879846 RepID=A0ABY4M9Q9_9ACTN|nr:hypothetical protein K9S39_23550 [Streptomyces halobius]
MRVEPPALPRGRTRSVADLRAAYEVLAGTDPQDPRAVPAPLYGPRPEAPVRVGVVTDPGGRGDVHPDVRAAIEAAAAALEDAGHPVKEVEVPRLQDALDGYGALLRTEFSLAWPMLRRLLTDDSARRIELDTQRHPAVGLEEYLRQTGVRLGVQRAWARFFEHCPLLLGPVSTQPAPEPVIPRTPEEHDATMTPMRLPTATTYVGVPAVAVPTGLAAGLPQGTREGSLLKRPGQGIGAFTGPLVPSRQCGEVPRCARPVPVGLRE